MSYKEVQSLDADVTVALGKINKGTGKPYPKQAEGYYLGNRSVESKRGDSKLHFLQTAKGNLGIWGTVDLNRKLSGVEPGTMVRITSTGTKTTPNGDMYTYRVETDEDNTVDVSALEASSSTGETEGESDYGDYDDTGYDGSYKEEDENSASSTPVVALNAKAQQAKVQEILNKGKKSKVN